MVSLEGMKDISDDPIRINVNCGHCQAAQSFVIFDKLAEPDQPLTKELREACSSCGGAIELDINLGAIDPTAN